jgi:hypothetical protein
MSDAPDVAVIRKNAREEFHVDLREFKGRRMIDLRVHADNGVKLVPTAKGVAIGLSLIDDVIDALQKARAAAVASGLLTP